MSSEPGSRPSTGAGLKSIPLDPGLCRNITIHGYCKWADKGCRFNHGEPKTTDAGLGKLRPDTPTFTPGGTSLATSRNAAAFTPGAFAAAPSHIGAGAPVFVPRGGTSSPGPSNFTQDHSSQAPYSSPARIAAKDQAVFAKGSPQNVNFLSLDGPATRSSNLNNVSGFPSPQINPYEQPGNDIFFQARTSYQSLQYHLYSSLPPNRKSLAKNERTAHDFFMNDTLRETLQKKQAAALQTLANSNLPTALHSYHSLVPLDIHVERSDRVFGYPSVVYKAYSKHDGYTYALRRVEGFKLVNEASISLVEKWRKVVNANVVGVKEAFTSRSFADDSIVFVHEYHPLSSTLYDAHFERSTRKFSPNTIIGEKLIWSYLTQLVNGVMAIHSMGLACRVIGLTKILLTEKNRLRIGSCSVLDVVAFDASAELSQLQRADVTAIGNVILSIAMNDANAKSDAQCSFDLTQRGYSAALNQIVKDILIGSVDGSSMTIDHLVVALAKHSMQNLDSSLCYNDTLESELGRETENGRLVRLLCKFGFINERPEFDHDSAWSETGERHVLKLFRDYVFHQVDDHGHAVVDMGHVLSSLNKLDAGIDERINLISRDEQTSIIISYKELKRCTEQAWFSLTQAHKNSR